MPTETFTAGDDFVVPGGVFELTVELEGTKGQDITDPDYFVFPSGNGGRVAGKVAVAPGDTLYIRESQGGAARQNGGDSIDIRRNGTALADRIAVAAGGGGGAVAQTDSGSTPGGDGGADTGEDAGSDVNATDAKGGTQSAGGAGGTDDNDGEDGVFGAGGDAGGGTVGLSGGGGGAGWYGGGGGAAGSNPQGPAKAFGGAGGSNYDDGLDTVTANERGTSSRSVSEGGLVTISYRTVTAANHTIDNVTTTRIHQSWDAVDDASEYRLYRSLSPGVTTSDTRIETTTDTSAVDTGLLNGRQYHYAVAAVINGSETPLSDEVTATTIMPAPVDIDTSNVGDTTAEVSWTRLHSNGETQLQVREDGSGDWTVNTTVAVDVEQATLTGLLHGQLYGVRVVSATVDAASADYAPDVRTGETLQFAKPLEVDEVLVNSGVVEPADSDVASGETLLIESGETFRFAKPFENAGTVDNRGVMQPGDTE